MPESNSEIQRIAERIVRRMKEKECEREDRELSRMLGELTIKDPDEMDISNLVCVNDNVGFHIVQNDNGEYHIQLAQKKK